MNKVITGFEFFVTNEEFQNWQQHNIDCTIINVQVVNQPEVFVMVTYVRNTTILSINQIKAEAVTQFANKYCGNCTTEYQTKLNEHANEWVNSVVSIGEKA
jgi:hypothetical protein